MKRLLLVVAVVCTGCVGLYGPDVPRPVVVAPSPPVIVVEPQIVVPFTYVRPYYYTPYYVVPRWRHW
jgi:hypothetical protein